MSEERGIPIFVRCEHCNGMGEIYDGVSCGECDGFGTMEVEGEPITLEDVHCRLFAQNPPGDTWACCGRFTVREDEWVALKMAMQSVNFLPEDTFP